VQGEYKQAFENFSRAYSISRSLNSSRVQLSRVLSGVAHAHDMLHDYTEHIIKPTSRTCVARLLDWKGSRHDEFNIPFILPGSTLSAFTILLQSLPLKLKSPSMIFYFLSCVTTSLTLIIIIIYLYSLSGKQPKHDPALCKYNMCKQHSTKFTETHSRAALL